MDCRKLAISQESVLKGANATESVALAEAGCLWANIEHILLVKLLKATACALAIVLRFAAPLHVPRLAASGDDHQFALRTELSNIGAGLGLQTLKICANGLLGPHELSNTIMLVIGVVGPILLIAFLADLHKVDAIGQVLLHLVGADSGLAAQFALLLAEAALSEMLHGGLIAESVLLQIAKVKILAQLCLFAEFAS